MPDISSPDVSVGLYSVYRLNMSFYIKVHLLVPSGIHIFKVQKLSLSFEVTS